MATITDVKRFKKIENNDNILVKEMAEFKKSNFLEIADTVSRYIDIGVELLNVLEQRNVFFDTFLSRGIYPYMRMACDVELYDEATKKITLTQRPLSINGKFRYEKIDTKYLENAILELYIDSVPAEFVDRSEWLVENVSISESEIYPIRKHGAHPEGEVFLLKSYLGLDELTFGRPMKFVLGLWNGMLSWSPVADSFSGRIEAYGSPTGVDGYLNYSTPYSEDSYLRFMSSSDALTSLYEHISRTKTIDIRKNNILETKYIEEDPSADVSNLLDGIDIEFGLSTLTTGQGVDSLGVQLIKKIEIDTPVVYLPGSEDIGNIEFTLNKERFGLDEFEEGIFLCSTLTNAKEYTSSDFPDFVRLLGIRTSSFNVRDLLYRKDNPAGLSDELFEEFTLNFTPFEAEMGKVVNGKLNVLWNIDSYTGSGTRGHYIHSHISDSKKAMDLVSYPTDTVVVKPVLESEEGVYIDDFRNPDTYFNPSDSKYVPGTVSLSGLPPSFLGSSIKVPRMGVVWYIILGFKPLPPKEEM